MSDAPRERPPRSPWEQRVELARAFKPLMPCTCTVHGAPELRAERGGLVCDVCNRPLKSTR